MPFFPYESTKRMRNQLTVPQLSTMIIYQHMVNFEPMD